MAREKLTQEEEIKIMKELEEFDTPVSGTWATVWLCGDGGLRNGGSGVQTPGV